jgi:predicted RNA binding protein YcfA (HicA-like mRNA interferase family)
MYRCMLGEPWVLSGREVCHILAQHGFAQVRHRGSHVVMRKKVPGSTITVPVPDREEGRIGTLQSIIRQPGPPRALCEEQS